MQKLGIKIAEWKAEKKAEWECGKVDQ